MRDETVSKNYAETLFELGQRHEAIEGYGEALRTLAGILDQDDRFRMFLETPRISDAERKKVVRKVLGDAFPKAVVNFVLVTIDKRRQRLLRTISMQYDRLLDEHLGREHVEVTLAREADQATQELIARRLSGVLGREALPHFRIRPDIIGGLVVRTGDTIYDGSIRRRLEGMRSRMLRAQLPQDALPSGGA